MCSKKFPSYTTNIFLSNAPQKIRQCALNFYFSLLYLIFRPFKSHASHVPAPVTIMQGHGAPGGMLFKPEKLLVDAQLMITVLCIIN